MRSGVPRVRGRADTEDALKAKNIYLVGFMGTGKTSVGRELARRLKRRFLDLDELIELRERKAIADIFAQEGQPYFRRVEKRLLREVSKESGFVVACGGGIVIDEENVKVMKETGTIICLQATPRVILQRTAGSRQRPLLNVPDPEAQVALLLKMRAAYYARADRFVDTTRASISEVADAVLGISAVKAKSAKRAAPRPKKR